MHSDDAQLLATYTGTGSPEAFRALAERHLPLVYAAARRQTRDAHEADDVTQAVFIVLARRAATVRNPALLPAWLLKVTHFAALNAREAAGRRRKHEQEAAAMIPQTTLPPDPEWERLSPYLDAALARLSDTDRAAIIAHCIREEPIAQLAASLGLTEPAARKRVQRALQRLRMLLEPHTAATSALLALPVLLAAHAVVPVPPALASSVGSSALAALSGTGATGSAFVLAKGVMHMMFLAKANLALVTTLALILLTIITGTAVHYARAQTPAPTAAPPRPQASSAQGASPTTAATGPVAPEIGWGPPRRGLRCRWVQPTDGYPAGSLATISMEVQNISDQPAFWECRGGSTWCVGYLGKTAVNGGILPQFSVNLAKGVRLATYRDVKGEPGFGFHPQTRTPDDPDDPVPAWYRIDSGATMTLSWEYPYVLAEEGTATIACTLDRSNPGGGGNYTFDQRDLNTLRCPPLSLRVTAGDPNAKHAYDVAWGPVSEGLQVGIYYEYGRRPVAMGKLVAIGVRIRTTGNKAVKLTHSQTAYRDVPPEVKDAAGRLLTVRMPGGRAYPLITSEIQPGLPLGGVDGASFTVLPEGADPAQVEGKVLVAGPGRYSVTKVFRYNTDGDKELSKQLTTGPIEVEVLGDRPAPAAGSGPSAP